MATPSPQQYRFAGRRQAIDATVLKNAVAAIERIRSIDLRITPVLTLRHLSELTEVPYHFLRRSVGRRSAMDYKFVFLKKRIPGRHTKRMISIPTPSLMTIQQWLVENVLSFTTAHEASFAFHPGSRAVHAAQEHCSCKWLLKVDLEDFFHRITEGQVAQVFTKLGFQRLLAFELARLVTVLPMASRPATKAALRWKAIPLYQTGSEGFLPQGAPTSPMLSNLVMVEVDTALAALATARGFRYSRYADDLAFSSVDDVGKEAVNAFKREVLRLLNSAGFKHNKRKTVVRGPGARRVVLGMLVDTDKPRLSQAFRDNMRLHLYYLSSPKHGPAAHARSRRTSISNTYHHVRGLISWARAVEPAYGDEALAVFNTVNWPPVRPAQATLDLWEDL